MIKPMEIAFDDINHIIIDISLVECHCVLSNIWVSESPITETTSGDFRIWRARKNNFVTANITAIILPRYVCSDPYSADKLLATEIARVRVLATLWL